MTTATLSLIILAALLAQVAAVALVGLQRRRRAFRERETKAEVTPSAPVPSPVPGGEGFREFTVEHREYEDGDRTICSFHLVPLDGQPLPPFKPGQFLTFKLPLETPHGAGATTVVRCYSLSDAPRPDHYRVTIKRVPAPPGRSDLAPGRASNFFHDHVQVGDHLQARAPSGHFHLHEEGASAPLVLIGGGIGITPMLSILNHVLESGSGREVWLYYGVRNGREQIMRERLRTLASAHPNFHLHLCYSAPDAGDVEGIDYRHRGRIDIPLLRETLRLGRYQFYVCGPAPMMESLVPGLEALGVASGDIHYEAFGPATLIRPRENSGQAPSESAAHATVTFSRSGKRLSWDPAADSLLAFAEANGIEVASGCRAGSCGGCQTAVASGEVAYRQQPDAEVAPGHCLLCIATPHGDLTLDA